MTGAQQPTMFTSDGLAVFFQSGRTGLDAELGARLRSSSALLSIGWMWPELRDEGVLSALKAARSASRLLHDAGLARAGGPIADPEPGSTGASINDAGLGR